MNNLKVSSNSWRQDKNKVMKFINNNPYLINNNIIKIIPKTKKNTWKEIKEDLKRQYLIEYNRRKSIRSKRQEQKSEPIDFIQSNIFAVETVGEYRSDSFRINNSYINLGIKEFKQLICRLAWHTLNGFDKEFPEEDLIDEVGI